MTTYIEQTLVFISAAVILVPIFNWLKLGSVLGYLMAGIVVGPYGLKLIHDSENVMHFAELGVVLLLFLIGLEIHPHRLWSMRRYLLGMGGLQVLLSFLIFTLIAFFLGERIGLAGTRSLTTSAVLGLAFSLSSTAFALQTLAERNQMKTEFGQGSFAIMLVQDLVAIPALAIIPFLSQGKRNTPTLQGFFTILIVMVFLVLASRYLIRPLFRLIASTRAREIFTATTLFIVLGVAFLMQKVGLSAALGTFMAGVLLADSEYRHEFEANIEPFKGLLMGLFFIAVGMGVDLGIIFNQPILTCSLAITYLVIKFSIIYGIGRLYQLNSENAKRMAITIAQGGEFAFVIFAGATQAGLIPQGPIGLLTAVITLSMAFNPPMGILIDWFSARLFTANPDPLSPEIQKQNEGLQKEISKGGNEVIIAGFGRFGQVFGRILKAQGIHFVAIDHDPQHIELVRRFGNTVYYGDASRRDLLEVAGANHAKYFILCLDDAETSLKTAQAVRDSFPHLQIYARARNRGHAFDLMDLGIRKIKRETFDSSASFVQELLLDMGFSAPKANDIIEKFKRHDEITLQEQYKVRRDDKLFLSVAKQGAVQSAEVLSTDSSQSYTKAEPNEK